MQINPAWLTWEETQQLLAAFDATPLRFVGGCVRDALLGRLVSDIDIATPLLPEVVMALLGAQGIKTIPTGIAHGTVTALVGKKHFEITTLRCDVSTDGRHATVAFTDDWCQDASRRDFTMNALYCDAKGEITDFFSGVDDAKNGKVRFIGDAAQRIREDALRILRFFRFFAHYGKGAPDAEGLAAAAKLAAMMEGLSGERIQQEMLKLLTAASAGDVVDIMQQVGVWRYVIPQALPTQSLKNLPAVMQKTDCAPDATLSLAALLRSMPEEAGRNIQHISNRWKLSRAHHMRLRDLCGVWDVSKIVWEEKLLKKLIRKQGRELFIDGVRLWMAEGADEASALGAIALARQWQIPEFPLTGDDLKAQGLSEGKAIGIALARLEEAWEAADYRLSKEELLKRL